MSKLELDPSVAAPAKKPQVTPYVVTLSTMAILVAAACMIASSRHNLQSSGWFDILLPAIAAALTAFSAISLHLKGDRKQAIVQVVAVLAWCALMFHHALK